MRVPIVKTKTTYLEMLAPSAAVVEPPRHDIEVLQVDRPTPEFYRQLYRSVGAAYNWVDRLVMSDEELRAIIHHERTDIRILHVAGKAAGYAELDRRTDNHIELVYFGLFNHYLGQGLGKFFLNWIVRRAWSHAPARLWLHTCDLDHPGALPTYLKAGFKVYDEKIIHQEIPDGVTSRRLRSDADSDG